MWIYKILIYGGVILKKAMIYVHGKGGSYLEAEQFKNICLDFDVFGVDYNDYFPWIVKNKIMEVYDKISEKYDYIYVLANSIGAYFTMHTLQNFKIEKALFISPILDMEQLIIDMMSWANVSEKELSERKEIPTDFGETLSWEYLCFVRANPINWKTPTEILYEPINGLDPQGIIEIRELILKLNHEHGITVLISSHILDELSRIATHFGFIDKGQMIQEISALELNTKCRKCVKLTVSNMEVLCNVLTEKGYDYSVISDKEIDVFAKLDITSLVVELAKKECNVLNIQEQDESLENYYINLIGGNRYE